MSRKIIYLINPISGTKGKSSLRALISRRTTAQGIDFDIRPTNATGNYDDLVPLIETQGVTDIVICGGDGTVSAVANALQGSPARIGIIPMGSGNGLAFAAGIPASPLKALNLIFTGKASPIDGFTINGHFSCMLCGIGLDGEVAHDFAGQKVRGLPTYIWVTIRHFLKARPYRFRINLPATDGGDLSIPVDAFFISVANGNQFGNHFTIAPKASLNDGLLDIVVVKRSAKIPMLLSVLRQVIGGSPLRPAEENALQKKAPNPTTLYFRTPRLYIENLDQAPLHIDGDPGVPAPVFDIRIVPKAITLIRP